MSTELIHDFIKYINEQNPGKLYELMTDDHTFIDAQNNIFSGRESMKHGWAGYFALFPDYKIEADELFESDNTFVMFGFASGTYKGINPVTNHWKIPAAWKALVEGGKVKLWQVYADTKIPYDIMEKSRD